MKKLVRSGNERVGGGGGGREREILTWHFVATENRGVSSSEDEGQEMVNISLYSTSPEIMHSFAATEIKDTAQFHRYCTVPGAHNEKQTGRGRSAKRPRSRLKFQIFPTVVELLNLEGEYIRYST